MKQKLPLKKRLPLYLLIAFIVANIVYMFLAPMMVIDKIERDTATISHSRGAGK